MAAESHLQHVNVNVDDLAAAVVFYRDVLGLALDPTPDQGFESQFFRINARQNCDSKPWSGVGSSASRASSRSSSASTRASKST